MDHFKNDCSVFEYTLNGKKYYEVKVQKKDKFGNQRKKSSRFTQSGKRITSQAGVNQVKLRLKKEIEALVSQKTLYTWLSWRVHCVKEMRNNKLKESTIKNYDGILDRWKDPSWDNRLLTEIERHDVSEYFDKYLVKKGASDWTRKNLQKRIHRIFEMAVDEGEISTNPARRIVIPAKSDDGIALTSSEVKTLLSRAKAINHPYYPHWVIALLTGLRNGELFALSYGQIDFNANTILINEQFTKRDGLHPPKSGKARTIDLGSELRKFILGLRESIGPQKAKLYRLEYEPVEVDEMAGGKKTGRKIMQQQSKKIPVEKIDLVLPRIRSWALGLQAGELREFCRKVGIREAKFHDLRATHITNLLSNGESISKVMNQVGHSQMSTTDAYHRLAGVEVKGITNSLGFDIPNNEESSETDNVVSLFPRRALS